MPRLTLLPSRSPTTIFMSSWTPIMARNFWQSGSRNYICSLVIGSLYSRQARPGNRAPGSTPLGKVNTRTGRQLWGRVHLADLREEMVNRVEQLVYVEGFSDTGEVTFLKRSRGQVGADDDSGDVCEVCDSVQAVIEGDAVHARELVVQQEQARFQVMHHLERLETVRHEQSLIWTLREQHQHEKGAHILIVFHH